MHRRRSVRSSARRAVNWQGGWITSNSPQVFNHGDVAVFWSYWPAGQPDFTFDPPFVNEPDQTVIRTLVKFNLIDNTPAVPSGFWTFGITPFDAVNPESYDVVHVGPGIVPDPFYPGEDWMIRIQYASPTFDSDFLGHFQTVESDVQSRAMRKLPPGTGLLGCLSWNAGDGATIKNVNFAIGTNHAIKVPR